MLILSRPNPRHFTWRAGIFIGAYLAVVIAASLAVEALINRMGQHEFANPAASFVMGVGAYWFPPLPGFLKDR